MEERDLDRILGSVRRNPRAHYREWDEEKPSGGTRRITAPEEWLKGVQRRINNYLQKLTLPDAVHGGLRGHSQLSNAQPHRFAEVLVQTDIKDFFPSIKYKRVYDMFFDAQECSPNIARDLTRLVTYNGQIPQGAPTSSIVAALVAVPLVKRCHQLASVNGGQMTIFVDDITLSGVRGAHRVCGQLRKIVSSEGFVSHPDKTFVSTGTDPLVVTGVRVGGGCVRECPILIRKIKNILAQIPIGSLESSSTKDPIAC